ncbi:MAG TPA: SCO family protein [Solirubrobacteraceae bacterium]|jgi:protein SCO1/2|nr:SCO family protein [Solirubrobacteraceae bacterium]
MNSLHPNRGPAGWPRATGIVAALVAGLAFTLAGCGSSSAPSSAATSTGATRTATTTPHAANGTTVVYDGPTVQTPAQAPPLVLRDYLGHRVDTGAYRGKAVLLTFIYTHCPDVCPLIVANLHNALALLGRRASEVRIVAVSTDPRGDTSSAIASFLARRDMTGRLEYLVGSRTTLTPVWRAWGISASKPTNQDEVNHSALVYGITASGKVTTVYPSNFTAAQLAHDVPLLAAN